MARVVRFRETGGPEVLKIEQLDIPPPGKGAVQISVKALGLNRAESMFRRGKGLKRDFESPFGARARRSLCRWEEELRQRTDGSRPGSGMVLSPRCPRAS